MAELNWTGSTQSWIPAADNKILTTVNLLGPSLCGKIKKFTILSVEVNECRVLGMSGAPGSLLTSLPPHRPKLEPAR